MLTNVTLERLPVMSAGTPSRLYLHISVQLLALHIIDVQLLAVA
jgi:hypothetical protein